MSKANDVVTGCGPVKDLVDVELGDTRRTDRYFEIVEALCRRPNRSVPEAFEDEAAQEGYYRFIRNPHVDEGALWAGSLRSICQAG